MVTYVFPGQGSQIRGMGGNLFSEFPDHVMKADEILGYSIAELCLKDPMEKLNQTIFTQPALYVVNALTYLKKLNETKKTPDFVAGHSLGEYNALFAAEVFNFETGLKLVKKRGELMNQVTGSGMAVVVGLKADEVQSVIHKYNLTDIAIANYNSYVQVVISGSKTMIESAGPLFNNVGAKMFQPLKVSGAFHSHYMDNAKQQFVEFLAGYSFSSPKIPIIANVNAKPYKIEEAKDTLANQINSPVQWTQTIEYLIKQGETVFEEIGPGKVLAGLISRIQKGQ